MIAIVIYTFREALAYIVKLKTLQRNDAQSLQSACDNLFPALGEKLSCAGYEEHVSKTI